METTEGYKAVDIFQSSPLAGDINRMETFCFSQYNQYSFKSPLAGDINRMETRRRVLNLLFLGSPHSLGTLIEWKLLRKSRVKMLNF